MDTGDLIFSRISAREAYAKQIGGLKAYLYIKTYNDMKYDAFTPGELDLLLGIDNLLKLSKQAKFPFLAANLVYAESKEPVFKAYTIKEIQGIKVGIFGLISDRFPLGAGKENEKIQITDPVEAAKKTVSKLRREHCRMIIALAHMEAEEHDKLAEKVRGIHFIVNGHLTHHQPEPVPAKHRTQILIAGARGEFMGQLDFLRGKRKVYSHFQLVPLREDYASHPKVADIVAQYRANLEGTLTAMAKAGSIGVPAEEIAASVLPALMGVKVCSTCHQEEHKHWLTTAHARAYQTLIEKNKTSDPHCLACHTTGFGKVKGSVGGLENVQCEVCHGPGVGHPDQIRDLPDVSENQCRLCHNIANSPKFNYVLEVQKIRHPTLSPEKE